MKKIVVFIMCFITFALAACGSAVNDDSKYLVLVNKTHQLPANWEAKITLVVDKDPWGDDVIIAQWMTRLTSGIISKSSTAKIIVNNMSPCLDIPSTILVSL